MRFSWTKNGASQVMVVLTPDNAAEQDDMQSLAAAMHSEGHWDAWAAPFRYMNPEVVVVLQKKSRGD
jgi:hypothetical protein